MLIRVNGGASGIKEYLETGQKQDRFYSRHELDERVILDGNLAITDTIIESMLTSKDKYFHITLAFKEDYIAPDILTSINQEFKEYFLAAYTNDEINYYAEAHLPKIKSYMSRVDNKLIERKPHIHIVIPMINLLDGASFNPLIRHIIKYINSFQEHINAKYGLESPKDNLRTTINDASEIISRYKGDIFTAKGKEQKMAVLDLILKHNPTSMQQLEILLVENGYEVKLRNKADAKENYLNIKQSGDAKGINLKDSLFRNEFLCLSIEDKLAKLNLARPHKYIQQTTPRETEEIHKQNMQEWLDIKALEIRFINRGTNKSERMAYRNLSSEDKAVYLKNKQHKYYSQHNMFLESNNDGNTTTTGDIINIIRSNESIIDALKADITRIGNIEIGNNRAIIRESIIKTGEERYRAHLGSGRTNEQYVAKHSLLDELKQQNEEQNKQQTFKNYLHELNSSIHADVLLELTEKTHGIQPELYFITKDNYGADRIKCGNRNLSLVDFCTKELNLSFKESIRLLDNAYHIQQDIDRVRGWSIKQDIYLKEQYRAWFNNYKTDRLKQLNQASSYAKDERKLIINQTKNLIKSVREDKILTQSNRAEQINILKARQIIDLRALNEAKQHELKAIRETFNLEMQASYRKFLSEQAKSGDEIALEELRRLRIKFDNSQPNINNTFKYVNRYQEFRLNITHDIDNQGNIYYRLNDLVIIKDTGKKIEVIRDTTDNVKLTLELAMAKFGSSIELIGTAAFRRKVVEIAIRNNYKVELLDDFSKQYHAACLEQIKLNTSKLENHMEDFTENNPSRCIISNINRLDIEGGHGKFKQINIYKIKDIQNEKEFIIKNNHLDYLQRTNNLDLGHIYDIKHSSEQIKFNLSNEAALRKTFKDQVIAEELTQFKESLKTKYDTDTFVHEYTGKLIKLGTSPDNKQYVLLKDKDGFKKIWNDEIASKLKNTNIQAGSYISVVVPINKASTKKIEIAQLDNQIEQKIDLKIKNLFLVEKHADLTL